MKQLNSEPHLKISDPISTLNGIQMSGFSKKRSDDYYRFPEEVKKDINQYTKGDREE
jgi:hypothetical protein